MESESSEHRVKVLVTQQVHELKEQIQDRSHRPTKTINKTKEKNEQTENQETKKLSKVQSLTVSTRIEGDIGISKAKENSQQRNKNTS